MRKAFTLIELLVVISIIGILAALVTVSFTASQRQAKDAQRKSDMAQYRNALENYANLNNGLYLSYTSSVDPSTTLCSPLGIGSTCPADPTGTYSYKYISDGTGAGSITATKYVLWAKLENIANNYWVVCSNGKSGTSVSAPTTNTCPI